MNYAVIDKNTNRLIAIVDDLLKEYFVAKLPVFDIVEITSVGSSHLRTEKGSVNTISINPKGTYLTKDCYHMITSYSKDEFTCVEEAYESINNR
jgi:hypothetical protein